MAQRTVRSVVDTILAEAGGKTHAQRREDMLGIASIISNRAAMGQVSPEDVVADKREFNAYGGYFPEGVEDYRPMAQEVWDTVQTLGPTHPGTFYSMPAKVGNLPKGLTPVATAVHQFFSDPAMRSYRTAVGYVQPSVAAFRDVVSRVSQAATGALGIAREQARTVPSVNINRVGPAPAGANVTTPGIPSGVTPGIGLQNVSPTKGYNAVGSYNRSKLNPNLGDALNAIGGDARFDGLGVRSGHRTPAQNAAVKGAKNSQHLSGNAVDISGFRGLSKDMQGALVDKAMTHGIRGIGFYSSGALHMDARKSPMNWGLGGSHHKSSIGNYPAHLQGYLSSLMGLKPGQVYTPAHPSNIPTPTARPATPAYEAAQRSALASSMSQAGMLGLDGKAKPGAPVGAVQRSQLGPATSPAARTAAAATQGVRPAGPVSSNMSNKAPAARPAAPSPAAPSNAAFAQDRLSTLSNNLSMGAQRTAPPSSFPARPAGPVSPNTSNVFSPAANAAYAAAAAAAAAPSPARDPRDMQNVAGPKVSTMRPLAAPVAPVAPMAPPAQTMAPKQVRLAPIARPLAPPVARPLSQQAFNARVNPVTPGLRPGDIYGGRVGSALASDGSTVARDNYGTTTVTNSYGVTTGMTPNGKQTAYGGGLFGQQGKMGKMSNNIGAKAKAMTGAMTGAALGGMIAGPVGGIIGGFMGKNVAQGLSPLGTGLVNRGFGSFPGAPSQAKGTPGKPGGGSLTSNRSERSMNSISPGASKSISKGKAGLY